MRAIDDYLIANYLFQTERIRGFSLAAHAIWSCCKPRTMTPPFWVRDKRAFQFGSVLIYRQLPVLSKDIRKVPFAVEARRGQKGSISPPSQPSTKAGTSTDTDGQGTSSTAIADSFTTSLPVTPLEGHDFARKPGRTIRYAPDNGRTGRPSQIAKQTRYWSEYDHPEDGSDSDRGYYIYVDPNEDTSWIPFRGAATAIVNGVTSFFCHRKGDRRARSVDVESDPLLRPQILPKSPLFDGSLDVETASSSSTSSSSDEDDEALLAPHILRAYGTLPRKATVYDPLTAPPEDAITILLASSLSLFFSLTLCLVLLLLSATGRRRARGEIDIVVIVGVIVSLAFAAVGFWGMVRGRGVGLTRWAVAGLVFAGVVLGDGVLVGWVLSQF